MAKKYIKKYRRRKAPLYKQMPTNMMVHWHSKAHGVTTDALGTDGKSENINVQDFRNVADAAGMFKSFRILAYGMDFGSCSLADTATYRTINVGLTARQIPQMVYGSIAAPVSVDQIAALDLNILSIPETGRAKKFGKWPYKYNEIAYDQLGGTPCMTFQQYISGADANTQYADGVLYLKILWFNKIW